MKKLKILGVHGLGDHRNSTWKEDWKTALLAAFPGQQAAEPERVQLEFAFVTYDDIFESVDLSVWGTMQAVWKLARSGVSTALGGRRGVLGDVSDRIRWTAGYVVAWVENERFQRASRQRVLDAMVAEQPDLVLAHSLGSLVTYNAFTHPDASRPATAAALRRARYVTLGSQIGNSFVVGSLTAGRVEPVPVKHWHHLYKPAPHHRGMPGEGVLVRVPTRGHQLRRVHLFPGPRAETAAAGQLPAPGRGDRRPAGRPGLRPAAADPGAPGGGQRAGPVERLAPRDI